LERRHTAQISIQLALSALDMLAQHAREVHGMQEVSMEPMEKTREVMRTE
jgi:hypothetical protein